MSPRGLLAAFSRFSRAARRQASQARQRRTARPATRAPHLAAESLESRCMLSTTARLENNISMFDRIPVIHPLRPANLPASFVGQFAWSGFNSFCVEIGQSISPGLHTFPTRAPLASSGLANAGLVADFWRSYGPKTTGFTSVTDAAAFQLGIWELISDGPSRNLKSGSFQVGSSASPAVARAESWLNGTGTPAPSAGGPAVSLYVLQHPTRQDQVVWEPRGVDLDVDSNNDGRIAEDDDPIEEKTDLPGVIVPVGGDRAKMVVDVPQGRTATLAITQGADKVRLWTAQTGGTAIPAAGTTIAGGAVQTYWIEAFAPSASMADIAFTLTASGTGTASSDKILATAAGMNMVAHRTGGRLGEVVSDDLESAGDPNSYMILTNRDFEQGIPLAGRDFDDEIALLPPLLGPEGQFDDDLAKLTLKKLPSALNAGSVRLKVSHPAAVRLFKADAATGLGVPLLAGEWSASLGGTGYLAQLKSRDVDIWLEGLSIVKDFVFTVEYVAPSGSVLASDDVHMLIADWTFRGSDGYEVPFVSPVWLDALLAATDSPKKPLADPTGAFYKIHIDGLAPWLVTQLIVASDSTPDFYTESYAGGDFDTAYSTATVSRRFGVLHSAEHVLDAPKAPAVTPDDQKERIRDTLDLNVVHNDGLEAKVQTAFDRHVAKLRAAPPFSIAVEKDVVPVNGRIRGTVTWTKRFPDDRPLFVHTNDGQESAPFDLTSAPGTMAFDFEATASQNVTIGVGWKSGLAPGGFATFIGSILVRITANGKVPTWEAKAWDALKVDGFVPGDPINRNRQINTRYAEMYNEGISQDRPNPYGWFGVAAFVSTGVGVGMSTTMSWDAAPDSVGVDSRKVVEGLADGNLTIFIDVYKQALAYRDGGLKELERMLEQKELSDERQLEAWTKIHAGMGDPVNGQQRVDEGVRLLVEVEQDTTLQRVLNKDLALWQTVTDNWGTWLQANVTSPHWKSFLMTAPIPGDYSTFQQFRYEDPGVPDKVSFADVNARLAWFDKKLFPAWKVWRAANPGTINIPKLLAGDYQK